MFAFRQVCKPQFPVELQDVMLTWTDHIVLLGHILYPNLDDSCDIDARRHDFCSQVNYFIARFGHLTPALKIRLFQTYCQSFYGSQIWDLNNNKINTFSVSWRKAVRRLWLVPYRTHRFLLPDLMLGKDFLKLINIHFISFANSCFACLNAKISFIAHVVCISQLHSFCNNLHLAYNTFAHSNPLCQDNTALSNVLCELLVFWNSCLKLVFLVVVILMILLRIFVAIEIVAYCGRVYLMLYELWALFVGFSGGLGF